MIAKAGQFGMICMGWPLAARAFNAGPRSDSAPWAFDFVAFASRLRSQAGRPCHDLERNLIKASEMSSGII
jgi:hypothetical protein